MTPRPSPIRSTPRAAVVLLHGLCSTPEELAHPRAALERAGHTVVAPRIAGYSFDPAEREQRALPYAQWLRAIDEEVGRLRAQGHAKVVLAGISAGAALALGAAIRCGAAIDGLVLMSTTLRFDGWAVPRGHWLLPLALYTPLGRWWRYRERAPFGVKNERVRDWIARELQLRRISLAGCALIGRDHLREHDRLLRHVRGRLSQVRCPEVLALHAREDEVASLANVELLSRGLGCASFRAVVLDNSYHMISIDNDRMQVARETVAFTCGIAAMPARTGAAHAGLS